MFDELDLIDEMTAHCEKGSLPREAADRLKTALTSLRAVQTTLTDARTACVAFGEVVKDQPDSTDVMRELGRMLEALGMAQILVERGPPV